MGMFDQDETITDEFFTSDETEQVEDETAESQDEEVLEETEELESDEVVESEDESSEKEQDETPLIAGKFKSQDDLVKAYKNLEKQFTQSRQDKQQPEIQQQTQQTQQQQIDPNEQFWADFQQNPIGMLSYLVNESVSQITQPLKEKEQYDTLGKEMDNLAKSYKQIQTEEGLTSLFTKAQEIAVELGNEKLARTPRVLKLAAIEAFGDSKAEVYKKAKEDGKKEADEIRRTKQEMSTITSSKKPSEKPKTQEELMVDSIMGAGTRKGIFG